MTPLIKFDNVYLKREDQNITGSAKDRAIQKQVEYLVKNRIRSAVISSSGNAAISASHFCQQNNIDLTVFLSPKVDQNKLKLINNKNIIFSKTPIRDAFRLAKTNHAYFLRQSTDPRALIGYQQIGQEILEQLPSVSSIFVPVGSGTTLLGIAQIVKAPIFAVYPQNFDLCDTLSVKFRPLKSQLSQKSISITIANDQILQAHQKIKQFNLSYESALALAGYYQNQNRAGDYPIIICTGTKR